MGKQAKTKGNEEQEEEGGGEDGTDIIVLETQGSFRTKDSY